MQKHLLFVSPSDGTVFITSNGEIPKSDKDLGFFRSFDIPIIETSHKDTLVYVVILPTHLKALAGSNASWIKVSKIINTNNIIEHILQNTYINPLRSNGTDSSQEKLNLVEQSLQSAIENVDASLTTLQNSQDPQSVIVELDASLDSLIESCNSALDTFRDIAQNAPRLEFLSQDILSFISNNQPILQALEIKGAWEATQSSQDHELIFIANAANTARIKRLHDAFAKQCIENERELSYDEQRVFEAVFRLYNITQTNGSPSKEIRFTPSASIIHKRFNSSSMKSTKQTVSGFVTHVLLPGIESLNLKAVVVVQPK